MIETSGQIFPSGDVIELVGDIDSSLRLLHWDGKCAQVAEKVEIHGKQYKPANLSSMLRGVIRLPAELVAYESVTAIVTALAATIETYAGLSDHCSRLAAFYSVMTWFVDCLPAAPRLMLIGPSGRGPDQLKRLLGICRHSIGLACVSPSAFESLPFEFGLTIALTQSGIGTRFWQLLDAATKPNTFLWRKEQARSPFSPVILHAGKPMRGEVNRGLEIEIPLLPVREELPLLDAEVEAEFVKRLQGQLLAYRLASYSAVKACTFDPKQLAFPTREIARCLGSCFPNVPALQEEIVALLRSADAHQRMLQSASIEAVLVEGLLFLCHEAQGDPVAGVYAAQLAEHVRVISKGRGDQIDLKPRAIGDLLRGLGFTTERLDRNGRGILLCREVIDKVHELAVAFHVPSLGHAQGCALCAKARK
jgi:hypothetical protein